MIDFRRLAEAYIDAGIAAMDEKPSFEARERAITQIEKHAEQLLAGLGQPQQGWTDAEKLLAEIRAGKHSLPGVLAQIDRYFTGRKQPQQTRRSLEDQANDHGRGLEPQEGSAANTVGRGRCR